MQVSLLWLYIEDQRGWYNIYFNVFCYAIIWFVSSNKLLNDIFEYLLLSCDSMHNIKKGVALNHLMKRRYIYDLTNQLSIVGTYNYHVFFPLIARFI